MLDAEAWVPFCCLIERKSTQTNKKFNFLNELQEKYISVNFSTQKMEQEENNLLVAQTVMDIMKDLVINHNDPEKYFTTE